MPAANFSCFRLVGTVKDINGRFLLMKMKGLIHLIGLPKSCDHTDVLLEQKGMGQDA